MMQGMKKWMSFIALASQIPLLVVLVPDRWNLWWVFYAGVVIYYLACCITILIRPIAIHRPLNHAYWTLGMYCCATIGWGSLRWPDACLTVAYFSFGVALVLFAGILISTRQQQPQPRLDD